MNIYLVRHGVTSWNVEGRYQGYSDIDLLPQGLAQAWKTADFFAGYSAKENIKFSAIYSSPLRRAWRTAAAISDRIGVTQRSIPDLAEMSGGAIEGLLLKQWQQLYPELIPAWADESNLDFGWPGGETRREFNARCQNAIAQITARHDPDDNVIVVTHGGVILSYLTNGALDDPAGPRAFDIHNCGVTHVRLDPNNETGAAGCLVSLNNTHHLQEIEPTIALLRTNAAIW